MPSSSERGRTSLAKNTVAQSSPLFVGYLASFVTAPFVLSGLGLRQFGIWALTGALASYAGLLDFGVGPSLSRFIALYDAEGRDDLVGQVLAAGLLTSFGIGGALACLAFFGSGPLAQHIGHISQPAMAALLLSAACMFLCSLLFNALTAYKTGMRQMVGINVVATIGAVLNFAFSIGSVLISGNLVVYALANAAASVLLILITVVYLVITSNQPAYRRPTKQMVTQLLSFSLRNQMQTAASLINVQTDKIIIAVFIGPAAAGAYELGNRVAAAARSIGVYTVSALTPTLTAELRNETSQTIAGVYQRLTEKTTAISVPILAVVASLSPVILDAWLGYIPHDAAVVLAALCVGYVVNTTTGVGFSVAYAKGYPGIPARAGVVMATANIVLTVALAPLFGLWGVLVGTALAFTGGAYLQVVLLHRKLEFPIATYWRATLPTYQRCLALSIPLVLVSVLVTGTPRWVHILAVAIAGGAFIVTYTCLAARAGVLPDSIARRLPSFGMTRRAEAV
jgi:O-antigen/teichoic acid export membrane protein